MMTRDPSLLDADERTIAAQLARHAPSGAPAPALDAAVLAAARAATAGDAPARPQRTPSRAAWSRRRRWPAITGVAASLALAAGIAWQLRPMPAAAPVQDEAPAPAATAFRATRDVPPAPGLAAAPAATPATAVPGENPAQVAATAPSSGASAPPPATMQMEAVPQGTPETHAGDNDAGRPPLPPMAPAPAAEPPSPATSAPVDRAPATATSAPPTPVGRATGATAVGRQALRGAPVPSRTAVAASDAGSAMHTDDEHAGFSDGELDDSPPATVDSPEVHQAWLQRIRELRDSGRSEAARESLAELQRRFPDLPVPDDLAALAEPQQ